MDSDVDKQPFNSRKLNWANEPSLMLKNIVNKMIDRNTVIMKDLVISELAVFFFLVKRIREEIMEIPKENSAI